MDMGINMVEVDLEEDRMEGLVLVLALVDQAALDPVGMDRMVS